LLIVKLVVHQVTGRLYKVKVLVTAPSDMVHAEMAKQTDGIRLAPSLKSVPSVSSLFVWLVGWLIGWLIGWLVGWLVRLFSSDHIEPVCRRDFWWAKRH